MYALSYSSNLNKFNLYSYKKQPVYIKIVNTMLQH